MIGDGFAARQLYLVGFAVEHALDVRPLEPARGEDLVAIHFDLARKAFTETTDHQTRRKRPGLAREISHAADAHADLFIDLAPDGFLDRLSRLDEPCQG